MVDFNLPWWAALLVCLAVALPVAHFSYTRLKTQYRLLKFSIIIIRSLYTIALLLLALDTTFIRTYITGSKLLILRAGTAAIAESASRDDRLNERFQVSLISGELPELERLLPDYSQENGHIAAVVIAAGSADEAIAAVELARQRIDSPLFVALDARSTFIPDVSVSATTADGRAILGAPATIQATVYGRNMAGRTTGIELRDEIRPLATASVIWKSDNESVIVPLTLIPAIEGVNSYSIIAGPDEKESEKENNELSFSLDVFRSERRILFMENQPTWEGKFIRRALQDNSLIKLDYFAQISRDAFLSQGEADGNRNLRRILASISLLAKYDAIIAGPMDATFFSSREARNISDFIERRGGGLVILGSNDFSGSIISPSSPLAHLSPADVSISARGLDLSKSETLKDERATFLVPTVEGQAEGLFQSLTPGGAFDRLGPVSTAYLEVGSLRPGAVAFARDGSITGDLSPVLLAGQSFGHGRTLLVSPADSWRMTLAETGGERDHFSTFWQNLALWASARAERRSFLRLASATISTGERATAYLTARDVAFQPLAELSIEAELEYSNAGNEGGVQHFPVLVEAVAGSPAIYKLSSPVLQEGKGTFKVKVQAAGHDDQTLSLAFDVQQATRQRLETPDRLDRLGLYVRESGGQVISRQDGDHLIAELLKLPSKSMRVQSTIKMRNMVFLAYLLPLFMATEYLLRRKFSTGGPDRQPETEMDRASSR
jgi:hypothetical protein